MADIVLKDKNGNPVVHRGITGLVLQLAGGGTRVFGSSGWVTEKLKCKCGHFTATSQQMTISHQLGAVPDFIFVGREDVSDAVNQNNYRISWAIGWSRRMIELEGANGNVAFLGNICIGYPNGEENVRDGYYFYTAAIDEEHEYDYGGPSKANANNFTVGLDSDGGNWALQVNAKYFYIAISGLGIRAEMESDA